MGMACPGKVTALTVTMDGVYCAAGIGDKIYIWEVSPNCDNYGMRVTVKYIVNLHILNILQRSVVDI